MAHGMRGSTPWQGGSKCPQILLPQGWGLCTFSGEGLANLATGPLTVLPVGKSQSLPQDRVDQVNTSLARSLAPSPSSSASSELSVPGPGAELALPPDRWVSSQSLTPTRHHNSPEGGLRLLLGRLPTLAPWLTSAGWRSPGRGVGELELMLLPG